MKIEKLLEKVKAGDTDALNIIYERYSPMMRSICFSITKEDEDTINDLVQDVFVLTYYSLSKLKDNSKFKEWCAAITKNTALKHLEKKSKLQTISFSSIMDEELEIEGALQTDSLLHENDILELINSLPTGYGKVFRMSVIEGFSHKEIADKLGIEPHSSSSQLARAKAMLRNMIDKRALAAISIILISIPLCKYLFWKKTVEEKKLPTANVERKNNNKIDKPELESISSQTNRYVANTFITKKKQIREISLDSIVKSNEWKNEDTIRNIAIIIEERDTTLSDTTSMFIPQIENYIVADTTRHKKNKWQFLATGSLGSALAQNVYKLIASNNNGLPDPDGPTPIIPNEISTWEDYYKHLQQKEHEGMSADTLALMTIAKHNSGKIVEHEQHDKPITFGISLTKNIGKNWSLGTGIQYSLLKSNFTLGEGEYFINRVQKVHYLGIPLSTSYKWFNSKNWSAYSSAGIIFNIPMYGKNNEQYVTGITVPYKDSWHFIPSVQWSVGVGTGLQYHFAPNWSIYLEPSFNWYIPNGSTIHTIWTEHPFSVTVPFGIRFAW